MQPVAAMLREYPILRSRSSDHFIALIERATGLRMRNAGRESVGESVMHGLWLRRMCFSAARYGFASRLAPAEEMTSYHLALPLRGVIGVTAGETRIVTEPGGCALMSPGVPTEFHYPPQFERITVRIDVDAVMRQYFLLTGRTPANPPRFAAMLPRGMDGVPALLRHIVLALRRIDAGHMGAVPNPWSDELESSILSALLAVCPDELWRGFDDRLLTPCPRSVHRVIDFIHANAHEPVTLEDLVAISGVAGRTLFKHFKAFKSVGPMSYLRRVRMERAREALSAAAPGDSVTAIALRWGFHELGRFAGSYLRQFGEKPSETLRRAARRRH
jgi:AraC-like DNA-binding protein